MLRKEAVAALRSYTLLPAPVQGFVERQGERYGLGALLVNDDSFERLLARADDADVLCLRSLRVMRSGSEEQLRLEGSFRVHGRAVRLGEDIFAVGALHGDDVPEGARSASGTYLVSFRDEDLLPCPSPSREPYGTSTTSGALVPGWNYLAALYDRRVARALVACPNGLFSLATVRARPELSARDAQRLLANLRDADLMVTLPRAARVARLASNCLLAAPEGYDAAALLAALGLPGYAGAEDQRGAVGGFAISRSLLDTSGPRADYDALRAALPSVARLERQSLSRWQSAPVNYDLAVELRVLPGQEVPQLTKLELRLDGQQVRVAARHVPFRALAAGETDAMLRGVLVNVLRDAVKDAFRAHRGAGTESELKELSRALGTELARRLGESRVFGAADVQVQLDVQRSAVEGDAVPLPSGERVVVPDYAIDAASPRLAAYLGVLTSLGVMGRFHSWRLARGSVYL